MRPPVTLTILVIKHVQKSMFLDLEEVAEGIFKNFIELKEKHLRLNLFLTKLQAISCRLLISFRRVFDTDILL